MAQKFPTQEKLLLIANIHLTSPTRGEQEAGQCKRWVRLVQEDAGVPKDASCPPEIDAKECAEWYRKNRPDLIADNGSLPGDICFWENGHGPHGHVFIRDKGNSYIGNTTRFAPAGKKDGRGRVPMYMYEPPSLVIRTWKGLK